MDWLLEKIFTVPQPPPRVRTKPMQVICVGLSRSATESLRVALEQLGFTPYHGWDLVYEKDIGYIQGWTQLQRRKWEGPPDGDLNITAEDFDVLLGHADAVVETPAWFFASEMIQAYPDAKVVLNLRRDLDAWHRSVMKSLVEEVEDRWSAQILKRLTASFFWKSKFFYQYGFRLGFRTPFPGWLRPGLACNGKWVYREHCNMIRGLVPKDRLLEWSVEDGWEPLCEVGDLFRSRGFSNVSFLQFLGKPCPDGPFPNSNSLAEFKARLDGLVKEQAILALRNLLVLTTSLAALTIAVVFGSRGGLLRLH